MCGGFTCSKNSLIALNLLYIVVAITLICVGAYARLASVVSSISIVSAIIACGIFLLFLSIIGICAARKHHQVLLFFYMVILFLIFIIQFSVACACLALNEQQQDIMALKGWDLAPNDLKHKAEVNFHCCGYEGSNSEHRNCSAVVNDRNQTCCPVDNPFCCSISLASNSTHEPSTCQCKTCKLALREVIGHGLSTVGGIGLFFSFTEVIGCVIARRYRNQIDPNLNLHLLFESPR